MFPGAERMTELSKTYDPSAVEGAIYERWLAADVFAPDGRGSTADPALPTFTIIQPPPNVTGSLHIGHAQRTTVEDLMTRHARMRGHPTLLLPGLDHASIAAQFVMDGILAKEGEDRRSLGRERYLERIRAFSDSTKPVMLGQQRRVGGSFDWGRLRYTMDEGSAKAVRVAFERLYRDGLAYRTEALVNWCPGCLTSVSDLEVVATPETGTIWTIRYHLIDEATGSPDPGATISIATTRPETLLGDTAVAVRPDDPRYAALVGRRVRIPFVDRDVPIIADEMVDAGFGTGAVKITPAHDHDDHATGLRHGLPSITILADDASIAGTGTAYDGLDRFEARRRIVADLDAMGDLVGSAAARDGRRPLPAQLGHRRAAPQDPVVHPDGPAGGPRPRRHAVRPDAHPAGPVREDLGALADHDPRLEREPPAVVGPPHPGLVLPGRARDRLVARGRAGCLRGLRPAGGRAHAGPGHLRHLVQLRPVAVLDPRLARRHARLPAVLPDVGDGDRLRHHLLLGRPDDDAGPPPHRPRALPHRLPLGPHPRPRGPEDVEDEGQRRRPARGHRFQRAPTRSGSRSSTAPRPGRTSG